MSRYFSRCSVRLALAACALLVFVPWAAATPIIPGMTALAAAEPDPLGGVLVAGGVPVPFASSTFTGTLVTSVIAGDATNPWGGLTFTYQLFNNPASFDSLDRLTANGYAGFLTDASFQVPPAGVAPTLQDRSLDADVMGFSFIGPPLGAGVLAPGAASAVLVVQTNAPFFVPSFVAVINGDVATAPSFAPSWVIPEPAALSLLALGGLAMMIRRRRA